MREAGRLECVRCKNFNRAALTGAASVAGGRAGPVPQRFLHELEKVTGRFRTFKSLERWQIPDASGR